MRRVEPSVLYRRGAAIALLSAYFIALPLLEAVGQNPAPQPNAPGLPGHSVRDSTLVAPESAIVAGISERDLIAQAFHQIDTEARRLDRLIGNAELVGSLVVTLIAALSVIVSVFAFRSISELKRELQNSVEQQVDGALSKETERRSTFESLARSLRGAEEKWDQIQSSIRDIEKFYTITESQSGDSQAAYKAIDEIAKKSRATEEDRRVAITYLGKLIQLGTEGRVDPNTLYNASSSASKLDFDFEAIQLATLCAHWDPKPSHLVRKSRMEDVFGFRFVLEDGKLQRDSVGADVVRREAWQAVLDQVRGRPIIQCELILSEAHNIAVRNREAGFLSGLIAAAEDSRLPDGGRQIPSYLYVILAGLYAMRGDATWRLDYDSATSSALETLRLESPLSTWYQHTVRDALKNAERLGERAVLAKRFSEIGLNVEPTGPDE